MHTVGLRSHYVASSRAVPIMLRNPPTANPSPPPLIAMISSFGGITYTFNVAYGAGKAAVDRLAKDMAVELKPHQVRPAICYAMSGADFPHPGPDLHVLPLSWRSDDGAHEEAGPIGGGSTAWDPAG
eukprot:1793671-Rhodomonas_salina.2